MLTAAAPAPPVLAALPAYSAGSSKTLSWAAVSGATSYSAQISTSSNFAANVVTQTVTVAYATFSRLADGTTYYYRVAAVNGSGLSAYSNTVSSTQDTIAPGVTLDSPASGLSTGTNLVTVTGTASDARSGVSGVKVKIGRAHV